MTRPLKQYPRSRFVGFQLSDLEFDALERIAEAHGRTVSQQLRALLHEAARQCGECAFPEVA